MKDDFEWQGKREDQVVFSQVMVAGSIVASIVLIIIWTIGRLILG
tara:strand:- start:207 stop:341 length:135 start_codon:yes stop_codon:yes gene_type:complete